tara:strand:+ start:483 stop:1064 length:582 start_codon:yes stop_codon:yes gene_type:complete
MGKVVTIAAIVGVGYMTGGFGLMAAGGTALPAGFATNLALAPGLTAATTSASIFTATNAGYAFGALSAVSSLAASNAQANNLKAQGYAEQLRQRQADLAALQKEAQVLKQGNALKGNAIARAAAQGQDLSGRSFLAFLDDQENELNTTVDTIRVNAEIGSASSDTRLRAFKSAASTARTSGYLSAGRSLLKMA